MPLESTGHAVMEMLIQFFVTLISMLVDIVTVSGSVTVQLYAKSENA